MGEQFFASIQQNIKLFLYPPILCALFRALFIYIYSPYDSLKGRWNVVRGAFRYGFWWGMDFNAYVFLIPFVLITLPGLMWPGWETMGDTLRLVAMTVYGLVIYAAFAGKLIFYKHFHDTYNYTIHYGRNAEKHNLVDIFFNQDHGWWILLGFIPVGLLSWFCGAWFLGLPSIAYPALSADWMHYAFNTLLFVGSILGFYWFRYGGTLIHDDKPEWDTIPTLVKEDLFFARATMDDLVALEKAYKQKLHEAYTKSDEELAESITAVIPEAYKHSWQKLDNPLRAFHRVAQGPRIKRPKHIFLLVGESIPQWTLDEMYKPFNICPGLWDFKEDPHTAQVANFLPAGNVSRPSIVSLMSGLYDAGMEINERESFWNEPLPTALAHQMRQLGYKTVYWYGGNASYGNFNHFGTAQGFDQVESASIFCGPDAPKTWVGVYDHVFLETIADRIADMDEPTFHFIYTTSNHGPYKIEDEVLDYDPEVVMPHAPDDVKSDKKRNKMLATYRYADRALFNFVKAMKAAHPDSLFVVTGDHSQLFGELNHTSYLHRDYTLREMFCTVGLVQHPELDQSQIKATIGSHMSIMPTIIEAVAPKGFEYYSIAPSLFEPSPDCIVTPYQWMTDTMMGATRGDYGEEHILSTEPVPQYFNVDNHRADAERWEMLTAWLIKHR